MPTASPPPRKQSLLRRLSSGSSSSNKQRPPAPTEPVPKLPTTLLYESMARQQPTVPPLIIPGSNGYTSPERNRIPVRARYQAPHPALASAPNSPPRTDESLTQSTSMTFATPPAYKPQSSQAQQQNRGFVGNGGVAKPLLYAPLQNGQSVSVLELDHQKRVIDQVDTRPKLEIIASSSTSARRIPSTSSRQSSSRALPASSPPPPTNPPSSYGQFEDASYPAAPPSRSTLSPNRPAQAIRSTSRSRRPGAPPSPASGSPVSSTGPSANGHAPLLRALSTQSPPSSMPATSPRAPPRRLSTTSSISPTDRQPAMPRFGSPAVQRAPSQERKTTLTVIASSDPSKRRQSFDRSPMSPPLPSISPSRPLPPKPVTQPERPASAIVRPSELYPPSRRQSAAIDLRSPSSYAPKQLRSIPSTRQVPRRPGRASLASTLGEPKVAAALLPHLSINSFLALNASSDEVRKDFGGELVGRWVLKEWGVNIGKERGRSWPGLGVWEGFLESLLHDVAAYSSYPVQYHQLLQHLCLSHTLVVLHLRTLPSTAFPSSSQPGWDDDMPTSPGAMSTSNSLASFASLGIGSSRSRVTSTASSDAGSIRPSNAMPRQERLIEIVMPEPLAAVGTPQQLTPGPPQVSPQAKVKRRGSISSISSASFSNWGRKRSNSTASSVVDALAAPTAHVIHAAPMAEGKAAYPPVSFPTAKRYAFRSHGDPSGPRSRTSSDSGRPGSIWSAASSAPRAPSFAMRHAPPHPPFAKRTSMAGSGSPLNENRQGSPNLPAVPSRPEPAFDKPIPYTVDRAPALRVFVPLSASVRDWPSAEGAYYAMRELEKCGASKRLKMGDLVVNPAMKGAYHVDRILIYVPNTQHLLLPLSKIHSGGHLPPNINALELSPSYYLGLFPAPHIVYLDLAPFAQQIVSNIRLTSHKGDVTTARGDRVVATRYLFVAGCEIRTGPWKGLLSLEAEGTAEGKLELEARVGGGDPRRAVRGPWEIVREMQGTVWLRLVRERATTPL